MDWKVCLDYEIVPNAEYGYGITVSGYVVQEKTGYGELIEDYTY